MIPVITKLPGSYDAARRAGFNARHDFWRIRIHWDLPYAPAILGQERFEWWFKKKWNALFSAPLWILFAWMIISGSLIGSIASGLGAFAVFVLAMDFMPGLQRQMELIGKNIEVIIASLMMDSDWHEHRGSEIRSLQHYKQFEGWSYEQIDAAFFDQEARAFRWVTKNTGKIERWIAEHGADS